LEAVIGPTDLKSFEKLAVAREKFLYGVKQDGFAESAWPGRKEAGFPASKRLMDIPDIVRAQIIFVDYARESLVA
jgi:hypothetical protein